jgi:hypothetical protein
LSQAADKKIVYHGHASVAMIFFLIHTCSQRCVNVRKLGS